MGSHSLVVFALVALLSSPAWSQMPSGVAQGHVIVDPGSSIGEAAGSFLVIVRTHQGNPVHNAKVDVIDPTTGRTIAYGYTNYSGVVEIPRISTGDYEVVATSGLMESRQRAHLQMVGASVELRMPPSADPNIGGSTTVSVADYQVPGKARKEFEKAERALKDRKIDVTKKHLEKALKIFPDYSAALTVRALIKMDEGETESALDDLNRAIQGDGSYAMAYFVRGAALVLVSRFDEAIESLDRGLALQPQSWQGYFEMAKAHIGRQDYRKALGFLDKAQLYLPEEYAPVHLARAHALLALKSYGDAMIELQAYLSKADDDDPQIETVRKTLSEVKAYVANSSR